jgi:hypothetical protein
MATCDFFLFIIWRFSLFFLEPKENAFLSFALSFFLLAKIRKLTKNSAKQKKSCDNWKKKTKKRRSEEDDRTSHATTVVDLGSGGSLSVLALIPIMDDYWASWTDGWMEKASRKTTTTSFTICNPCLGRVLGLHGGFS